MVFGWYLALLMSSLISVAVAAAVGLNSCWLLQSQSSEKKLFYTVMSSGILMD